LGEEEARGKASMKDETIVALFGMGCAAALGLGALWKGFDTALVMALGTMIGTIAGYAYGVQKRQKAELTQAAER